MRSMAGICALVQVMMMIIGISCSMTYAMNDKEMSVRTEEEEEGPASGIEKRAFVTVITTQNYVQPGMIMGASLRAHTITGSSSSSSSDDETKIETSYICLVLLAKEGTSYSETGVRSDGILNLRRAGWEVRPLEYHLWNPNYDNEDEKESYVDQKHVWNYSKLWIWSLVEFDKIIYLDSDVLILRDITHLFDRDIWTTNNNNHKNDNSQEMHRNFAAAPDMIPPDKFNSGVLILRPSLQTFNHMRSVIANKDANYQSYNRGDQGFLNAYFHDWYDMPSASRLPIIYNAAFAITGYQPVWDLLWKHENLAIVHFYGDVKPWDVVQNPEKARISGVAVPLIYLWAGLTVIVTLPGEHIEDEARYLLRKVYDISSVPHHHDGMLLAQNQLLHYVQSIMNGMTRGRLPPFPRARSTSSTKILDEL